MLRFAFLALFSAFALANPATPLKWSHLQPDDPALRSQIESMGKPEKARLVRAVNQRDLKTAVRNGDVKPSQLIGADQALLTEQLGDLDPLVDRIVAFEQRRTQEIVKTLDRKTVRLKGYLLPTQQNKGKVTEFLLVPVVGACIHVPPPPANQMVVVRYPDGYRSDEMFAPVEVTGVLRTQSRKANLALADGAADVDVAYTLDATAVARPFK
ncbi:DUF3299 domain-containing protein [Chitinibacteraceae bacterium HSL-7]